MALRLAVLPVCQRRLGDQRPKAGVVGFGGELIELFVGDGQLITHDAQAIRQLGQAALDEGTGHRRQV